MVINSSGNVGIGTTYPTEKLEVNGSIKANNVKIPVTIFGNVDSSGQMESGIGFTSARTATGKYRVNFNTSFTSRPSVITAQVYTGFDNTEHTVDSLHDDSIVNAIQREYFLCATGKGSGILSDRNFSFIATGYT